MTKLRKRQPPPALTPRPPEVIAKAKPLAKPAFAIPTPPPSDFDIEVDDERN